MSSLTIDIGQRKDGSRVAYFMICKERGFTSIFGRIDFDDVGFLCLTEIGGRASPADCEAEYLDYLDDIEASVGFEPRLTDKRSYIALGDTYRDRGFRGFVSMAREIDKHFGTLLSEDFFEAIKSHGVAVSAYFSFEFPNLAAQRHINRVEVERAAMTIDRPIGSSTQTSDLWGVW